jgi:4-amino-4-deoxy-L-arabinose transferase-like glycosyltransferase
MPVIIKDIRFWIIAFFLIRLIGITNPPLEVSHNWRQTTVAMAARNFAEADNNILYPRIDIAGEKSGITGMEFPLLNYLIYLMSVVFGYDHWYGRLINLIVSSFGLWYFFRLVKDHFSEQVAFNSTIVLAVSVWFQFSRKIMPDTFAVSIVIAALYYASCYFRGNENHRKQLYSLILFSVMLDDGSAVKTARRIPLCFIADSLASRQVLCKEANGFCLCFVRIACSLFGLVFQLGAAPGQNLRILAFLHGSFFFAGHF